MNQKQLNINLSVAKSLFPDFKPGRNNFQPFMWKSLGENCYHYDMCLYQSSCGSIEVTMVFSGETFEVRYIDLAEYDLCNKLVVDKRWVHPLYIDHYNFESMKRIGFIEIDPFCILTLQDFINETKQVICDFNSKNNILN